MNKGTSSQQSSPPPDITGLICDVPLGQLFKSDLKADLKLRGGEIHSTLYFERLPLIHLFAIWVQQESLSGFA